MNRPKFQLYKLSKLKYELKCNKFYIHGKNNLFNTETEVEEYYRKFISSWNNAELEIMYESDMKTQEELYNKIKNW